MKRPTRWVFFGLAVRLVVWTSLFLLIPGRVGIFVQKPPPNNRGWKEETDTDSKLQSTGKWSWYYLAFYVFSWLSRELCKNPTLILKMLTHQVIVFTALCLRSWLYSAFRLFWTFVLEPTFCSLSWAWLFRSLLWSLTPNWLILCFGVSLLINWFSVPKSHP